MTATPATGEPSRGIMRELLVAALLFGAAAAAGFAWLVLLFKSGVLARIDILFYRGIILCAIAAIATVALVWLAASRWRLASIRDAIAAGVLSFGLNLSFFVVAPVTVDRSVSVFILGYMATDPDKPMSVADLRNVFERRYLGDWRQVERRMEEQSVSGNVTRAGDGYVLTPRGKSFLTTSKIVAWMFDTDPRFVTQTKLDRRVSQASK